MTGCVSFAKELNINFCSTELSSIHRENFLTKTKNKSQCCVMLAQLPSKVRPGGKSFFRNKFKQNSMIGEQKKKTIFELKIGNPNFL